MIGLISGHVINLYNIANYLLGVSISSQKRVQNPAKHLRWSFLRKLLAINLRLKATSYLFDWVLNTLLIMYLVITENQRDIPENLLNHTGHSLS